MPTELELKLAPAEPQSERRVRELAELGFKIHQCYLPATGKSKPKFLRIVRIGDNRYLEVTDKKCNQIWRAKLSTKAWKRIKTEKSVLRVRSSQEILGESVGDFTYTITVKDRLKSLKRHEWERTIPRWVFRLLWSEFEQTTSSRNVICKRRYYIREDEQTIHLDFFLKELKGLVLAEIEFCRKRAAKKFRKLFGEKTTWGIKFRNFPRCIQGSCFEVTGLPLAGNRSLSKLKSPPMLY